MTTHSRVKHQSPGRPKNTNRFDIFGDSIVIWLDGGTKASYIDAADYPLIKDYYWRARRGGNKRGGIRRATHTEYYAISSGDEQQMHNIIMGPAPDGKTVDHEDRNGLNNRRLNLRFVTPAESAQNRGVNCNKTQSGYKGVRRYSRKPKLFEARIQINKKRISLGSFKTEEEAAEAYNEAALKYFGDFAVLNELRKDDLIFNQK